MQGYHFKSIRTQLTFWFLILALVPLFLGILITYSQQKKSIEQQSFAKLTAVRNLKVEQLKKWLEERFGDVQSMAGDFEIRDLEQAFDKKNKSAKDIEQIVIARKLLNRYLINYDAYEEIFIINPNIGKVEISTNSNYEGTYKSNDPYITRPMETGGLFIKDIYYSKSLARNAMAFSIPIYCTKHVPHHIFGILVARVNLKNSLYALLQNRVGLGESGETLILNNDVIALNELRWYKNAPLKLKIDAEPAVNAVQGKTGITKTTDYRGEKILAAYTYIPKTKWGFVAKQDLYELNEPIRDLIKNLVILSIVATLVILLIVFIISKQISKPIEEMNIVTQKIKQGDYSARNLVRSRDELGSLANSINKTTDVLESVMTTQKSVSNISDTMIGQSSIQEFGSDLLKQLIEITKSNMGTFYMLNEGASEFEHFTSVGANTDLLKSFNSENPEGEFGNAISKKEIIYLKNIPEDTVFKFRTTAGDLIPKEIITIPVIIEKTVVALISLVNIHEFSKECIDILQQSWNAINSSYAILMSNERTRILAENLTKANQQLKNKTEELQIQSEELQAQSEELQQSSEELEQQNRELEIQKKQVDEANQLKSEFLSNMSHELRTPLNSIMALSRVLIMQAKDKLSEDENNYLEIVERNGKQLLSLINDILDLSKIEAGKSDVNPEYCSLNTMLNNIKDSQLPFVKEKDLDFKLSFADDLPKIETDEGKMHQILQNIISNAVKYTEKGEVKVIADFDSEKVIIEVIDTGIGIQSKTLPHIFEEFRQGDGSSSRKYEGTGLGLAIAYKLAKLLGGDISVTSKLGKGSTFKISLPIKWPGDAELSETQTFPTKIPEPEKKTILIVDDNPKFVTDISVYLKEVGYKIISASSGKEAIRLAEEHHPFAITLDVIMPEMDGWEALQRLKSNPKTENIPVIVISVSDERDTGIALGAVGYLQKPVDKYHLISEINKLHENSNTVMIVDDSQIDREQMAQIIKEECINTILAEGGKECLELLQFNIPDVLVLDLLMPDIDGFQVLDKIRKEKKTQNLPVIVVTAKDLTREDKEKLADKASIVLAKSDSTPQDLFQEIKRILVAMEKTGKISEKKTSETHLLIVEDDEDTLIQMKTVLEKESYIVDVATDGKEALEYVKQTIPDGIILDLMMPEIDGFEVLERIRSSDATRQIPVLILTAKDLNREDLSKLSSNNIQQLIQKGDVDIDGLLFKIKLMLGNEIQGKRIKDKSETVKPEKRRKTRTKKHIEGLPRVLVVEDNSDNMITVKAILGKKYEILKAVDGEAGINKAINEKPDLVLLDISLPKVDGLEVLKTIKNHEDTSNIPVIVLTAKAMKDDRKKYIQAGCDEYISKPIDGKLLMDAIEECLGKE